MKPTLEQQFADYASICNQEKEVAAAKARVKKQIEEELGQAEFKTETPAGKFSMTPTARYKYSDTAVKMAEDLKILQEDEQEQGIAIKTEKWGLRFNAAKTE